ncbi:hypothetical protein [Thiomonas sp. FB-6]|uniref:hypothetical protein n=1 Tax=Thiomonas sp. FB-6 TaxID=1158291 RepID=UPI00035F4794|nr:hypothetical protein [Thiomonas sp. FB-6]
MASTSRGSDKAQAHASSTAASAFTRSVVANIRNTTAPSVPSAAAWIQIGDRPVASSSGNKGGQVVKEALAFPNKAKVGMLRPLPAAIWPATVR